MTFRKILVALVVVGLHVAFGSAAHAGVIYYDDFDGLSTADLNGTAPDTRPGTETWTAGTLWKADGSKSANNSSNAWLPFSPVSGNRYTLSLTVDPDISGSDDWLAVGFSASNGTDNTFHEGGGVAWMLNRENDASTSVVQTFRGTGTGGGASHDFNPDKVGPVNLQVVLDTQASSWTAEWLVDGASVRSEVLPTNPTINYAGLGAYNSATGKVDDFTLLEMAYSGIQIGLGTGFGTGVDNSQNRLNVEEAFVHLEAGTYSVLDFAVNSSAAGGNVTPFLARLTADNTYETLWVGPAFSPGGANVQTDAYALGTEYFTLATATDVYVGFAQDDPRVRFADPDGPSLTDHDSSFTTPTGPGQTIAGFSNPNLPRNYAFRVNVSLASEVPEPATLALAALGLAGLGGYVRRRRRA